MLVDTVAATASSGGTQDMERHSAAGVNDTGRSEGGAGNYLEIQGQLQPAVLAVLPKQLILVPDAVNPAAVSNTHLTHTTKQEV